MRNIRDSVSGFNKACSCFGSFTLKRVAYKVCHLAPAELERLYVLKAHFHCHHPLSSTHHCHTPTSPTACFPIPRSISHSSYHAVCRLSRGLSSIPHCLSSLPRGMCRFPPRCLSSLTSYILFLTSSWFCHRVCCLSHAARCLSHPLLRLSYLFDCLLSFFSCMLSLSRCPLSLLHGVSSHFQFLSYFTSCIACVQLVIILCMSSLTCCMSLLTPSVKPVVFRCLLFLSRCLLSRSFPVIFFRTCRLFQVVCYLSHPPSGLLPLFRCLLFLVRFLVSFLP